MITGRRVIAAIVVMTAILFLVPAQGVDLLAGRSAGISARSSQEATTTTPRLTVTPTSAAAGASVKITGSGFAPKKSGQLAFGSGSLVKTFSFFTADRTGAFTKKWTVPTGTQPGAYAIYAISTSNPVVQTSLTVVTSSSGGASGGTGSTPTPTATATPLPTPSPTSTTTSPTGGGANALTVGQMHLDSTFNSIGIELLFSGDGDANATAALQFKPQGDANWRDGLPLWRTDSTTSPGPAFYGSALLLDAGTAYDIKVTLSDPDGITGSQTLTGSITTRAENIPPAGSLTPGYYVSPNGNDANAGTSSASAWRTLDKALTTAPAGAVVQFAPGTYAPPTKVRTNPITLLAQYPAVDDNQNPTNAGQHSIIEPETGTRPNSGVWTQVSLLGPATGKTYTVWKWTAPISGAKRMNFASSQSDTPVRVAVWDRKSGSFGAYTMGTPAGWAEVLYNNDDYNYGFTTFGNDIYVRLPGDQNPNSFFVWVHDVNADNGAVALNAPNSRISGFEVRMADINVDFGANAAVIDHNLTYSATVDFRAQQGPPSVYPTDDVVQYNHLIDTSLWSTDPAHPGIPWIFVKTTMEINGQATTWNRVGGSNENSGVEGRGGAVRLVVRHNTIEGYFNGVNGYSQNFDRYNKSGYDIYDNVIRDIPDDSLEPDLGSINWRVWDNRIENASVALSTGPVNYGPIYFFRNQVWQLSSAGVAPDKAGDKKIGPQAFKYSGSSQPVARIYVINNTFWTNSPDANGSVQGAGGGNQPEAYYMRNNIFRMTRNAMNGADDWQEDYDYFYTSDPSRGIEWSNAQFQTVAAYRSGTGQGAHSNLGDSSGAFKTDPVLVDPSTGNLALPSGSSLIDAGVVVPNIADQYSGSAPDIGAVEH